MGNRIVIKVGPQAVTEKGGVSKAKIKDLMDELLKSSEAINFSRSLCKNQKRKKC